MTINADGSVLHDIVDLTQPTCFFTIDNHIYYSNGYMDWERWVRSDYNKIGLTIDEYGNVVDAAGDQLVFYNYSGVDQVRKTDEIYIFGRYAVS
jgi:hypothetical protein